MRAAGGAYVGPGGDPVRLSPAPAEHSWRGGLQPGAVLGGILVTFGVSLAAAGLLAVLVYATPITEQSASGFLFAIGLGSLFAGAAYGAHRAGGMGWAHGITVGLAYAALSLLLTPLLFPGALSLGGALQRLLLGAATGALGGVLGVNF